MASLTIDNIGWTYLGVTVAWSMILFTAMGFLWYHRRLPQLQMRRLPIVFIAMAMLHVYWILCMIGYIIGPVAPCAAEYWIMSILVPFGIAMFQIANTQFLYIASQQRRFASLSSLDHLMQDRVSALDGQTGSFWRRTINRLKIVDQITRMVIFVGIGMAIQAILAILIFLLSRKFHPSFGVIPANLLGTDAEQRVRCSRGWEWWLSIVWQFFWAWIYAPYILWKSRNIKDTHGWRIQTILCCIAGLPCSPLWLCGLYLPQFAPINAVFVPPNWFSISIFFIQSFTIFIPCYQVYRHHHLRTETLAAIAKWEAKNRCLAGSPVDSDATQVGSITEISYKTCDDSEKGFRANSFDTKDSMSSRKAHMYTMTALEHALRWNADPLQKFAALKDFSGENISFLTHLANWKKAWTNQAPGKRAPDFSKSLSNSERSKEQIHTEEKRREQFNRAITLYTVFISNEHAEFPLNLSSRILQHLNKLFSRPANLLFGDSSSMTSSTSSTDSNSTANSSTPFTTFDSPELNRSKSITISDIYETQRSRTGSQQTTSTSTDLNSTSGTAVLCLDDVWYWGDIPSDFGPDCFEDVEKEIKYLVLTNTWPKFVNAGCAEQIRDANGRTLAKRLSQVFYAGRYGSRGT